MPPEAKFKKIDEDILRDEKGNVYEIGPEGKPVPTGGKVEGEVALATPTPPPQGLIPTPRFEKSAMEASLENYKLLSEVVKSRMTRGHHYGKFEGWQKDQLLEPGASLIMNGFNVWADPIKVDRSEDEDGHIRYNIVVHLKPIGQVRNVVVAAGVGSASTKETKYAYRWVPESEVPESLEKNGLKKLERANRTVYRVPNPDIGDVENTLLKMAMKRAEIDAVNHLPGCSELFVREERR